MGSHSTYRLALIGCGAVSQQYIIPALTEISQCVVEWFVDTQRSIAIKACAKYGSGRIDTDYHSVISKVDGAIVAVPNYLHSKVSIDFLNAGRDVLCEKPIATSSREASAMIETSRRSGARLAVNFVRRRFESYNIIRSMLRQGIPSKIKGIEYEEGKITTWPSASTYMLDRAKSGGGVLIDWGSHAIDLLNWLIGNNWTLTSYGDDGLGRIEANCELSFLIKDLQNEIPCHVKLSYTRALRNKLVIAGEDFTLETRMLDRTGAYIRQGDFEARFGKKQSRGYESYFTEQIASFLNRSPDERLSEAADAMKNLLFIEDCYRHRQDLSWTWLGNGAVKTRAIPPRLRILVVGASGFLGTRLVEKLALNPELKVRAAIHRPERAIRLARLPVEFVECDLLNVSQVENAVKGCDVIVNCARGRRDTSESAQKEMLAYVRGTENLLKAAEKQDVKKLIHVSSAAVHGFKHNREIIDETSPFACRLTRSAYVMAKINSEKVLRHSKVPVVIFRPTLIYGPFSKEWAYGIIDRLRNKEFTLVGDRGLANLVFVDDAIDAILLAIEKDEANGKTFIINNDETVYWRDYVSKFSKIANVPPQVLPEENLTLIKLRQTKRLCADSLRAIGDSIRSREMLLLLARIPIFVVLGTKLVGSKKRREIGISLSSASEQDGFDLSSVIFRYEIISRDLYENLTCRSIFSSLSARTVLGWTPRTSFSEGIEKTLEWAMWANIVDKQIDQSNHALLG